MALASFVVPFVLGRVTAGGGAVKPHNEWKGECKDQKTLPAGYSYEDFKHRTWRNPWSGEDYCAQCPEGYQFSKSSIPGRSNKCYPPSEAVIKDREQQKKNQSLMSAQPMSSLYTGKNGGSDKPTKKESKRVAYVQQRTGGGTSRYYKVATDGSKVRLAKEEYSKRKKQQEARQERTGGCKMHDSKKKKKRVKYLKQRRAGGGGGGGGGRCYKIAADGKKTRLSQAEYEARKKRQESRS